MSKIKLQVLRPMCLNGMRQEPGTIFAVDAADACAMTESGRCALLNPSDDKEARAAGWRKAATAAGHRGSPQPPAGWPWIPHL